MWAGRRGEAEWPGEAECPGEPDQAGFQIAAVPWAERPLADGGNPEEGNLAGGNLAGGNLASELRAAGLLLMEVECPQRARPLLMSAPPLTPGPPPQAGGTPAKMEPPVVPAVAPCAVNRATETALFAGTHLACQVNRPVARTAAVTDPFGVAQVAQPRQRAVAHPGSHLPTRGGSGGCRSRGTPRVVGTVPPVEGTAEEPPRRRGRETESSRNPPPRAPYQNATSSAASHRGRVAAHIRAGGPRGAASFGRR